jgi:hypothetical protein
MFRKGAPALRVRRFVSPALAGDLHEEVPECIVEFLDMRQHSHVAASCGSALRRVHAVLDSVRYCGRSTGVGKSNGSAISRGLIRQKCHRKVVELNRFAVDAERRR